MRERGHVLRSLVDRKVFRKNIELKSILIPNPSHPWLQLLTARYDGNDGGEGLFVDNRMEIRDTKQKNSRGNDEPQPQLPYCKNVFHSNRRVPQVRDPLFWGANLGPYHSPGRLGLR